MSQYCPIEHDNMQCAAEVAYACANGGTWSEPIATEHASGNCAFNIQFDANTERVSNVIGYSESMHAEYAERTSSTDV